MPFSLRRAGLLSSSSLAGTPMRRAPGHSVSLCLLPGTTNPDASPGICAGDGHPDALGAAAGRVFQPRPDRDAGIAEGIEESFRRGRASQPSLRHLSIVGVEEATIGRGTPRTSRRAVRTRASSDGADLTLPKNAISDAPGFLPQGRWHCGRPGVGVDERPRFADSDGMLTALSSASSPRSVRLSGADGVRPTRPGANPCHRHRPDRTASFSGTLWPAVCTEARPVGNPDPMRASSPSRRTSRGQAALTRGSRVPQRRRYFLPAMIIPLRWASRTPRSTTRGSRV